ncbi:hypothetical protein KIN20_025261 [Parelaphostrongylus tenuis]|uniref:Uncharacterized protein n=1 Tax=Parelaphostrongylus tenuis TaxID=148309 RepID=A0AAD5N933_PARTN|nr:hypothetical protein KIN20_025261 [Parelaphostrongylus tenuis]
MVQGANEQGELRRTHQDNSLSNDPAQNLTPYLLNGDSSESTCRLSRPTIYLLTTAELEQISGFFPDKLFQS